MCSHVKPSPQLRHITPSIFFVPFCNFSLSTYRVHLFPKQKQICFDTVDWTFWNLIFVQSYSRHYISFGFFHLAHKFWDISMLLPVLIIHYLLFNSGYYIVRDILQFSHLFLGACLNFFGFFLLLQMKFIWTYKSLCDHKFSSWLP
jgi:hypothetical protein